MDETCKTCKFWGKHEYMWDPDDHDIEYRGCSNEKVRKEVIVVGRFSPLFCESFGCQHHEFETKEPDPDYDIMTSF